MCLGETWCFDVSEKFTLTKCFLCDSTCFLVYAKYVKREFAYTVSTVCPTLFIQGGPKSKCPPKNLY